MQKAEFDFIWLVICVVIFERQDVEDKKTVWREKWQMIRPFWSFALSQMKLSPLANGCAVMVRTETSKDARSH